MDNLAIARVLSEVADLLEIKGENPFKIRAYRNASETVAHQTARVAGLSAAERLALPGIGKDIAAKIGELVDTGVIRYHQDLLQEFPHTVLDLLNPSRGSAPRPSHDSTPTSACARWRTSSRRRATAASVR